MPAVLLVALLTFGAWLLWGNGLSQALVHAVAVLIVACPCAMGLATPTSILVGTGRAAELGILFRKGDALQQLCAARLVVFDKTGTLTRGRPELTGDQQRTAQAIADRLGIGELRAQLLPADKVDVLRQWQARQRPLVFVGDGINDAPALAQADVGIAIGSGTDVAMEAAEVVLLTGDLRQVVTAIALSRATLANIRPNLVWAFGYNVLLIPLAAGLFQPLLGLQLSPVLAALAMTASSLCVLTNALRLRRFRPAPLGDQTAG